MTPEEKYIQETCSVLQKIKTNMLHTKKGNFFVKYKKVSIKSDEEYEKEESILERIEDVGAIRIMKAEDVIEYLQNYITNNPATALTLKDLDASKYLKYIESKDIIFLEIIPGFEGFYNELSNVYQKDEVSLWENIKRNETGVAFEPEKEKKRIKTVVRTLDDHKTIKNFWLDVKNILDIIYKKLSLLKNEEQSISLNPENFSSEQKKILASVLGDMLKRKVGILEKYYCNNGDGAVATSDSIRIPLEKFFSGKSIIIKSRYDFENYKKEISEICNFIEEDGQKRFPEVYLSKDNKHIDYKYNENEGKGKLTIYKYPEIEFSKIPALIIKYFFDSKDLDNDYKSCYDFLELNCLKKFTSNDFRKRIDSINKRISSNTKNKIKQIICKDDIKNLTEINRYKWKIMR